MSLNLTTPPVKRTVSALSCCVRGVYFPPVTVLSPRHHVFIRYMKPICQDSTGSHLFLKPLRYRLGLLVFPICQRSTSRRHCRRECWHLTDLITPRINWSGCYRDQSATVQDI